MLKRILAIGLFAIAARAQNPNTAAFPGAVAGDNTLLAASDNAISPLAAAITSSATTIPLSNSGNFIAPTALTIGSEKIFCPTLSGGSYTGCTRGWLGTTAQSYAVGVLVYENMISYYHNQDAAEIKAVEAALGVNFAGGGVLSYGSSQTLASANNAKLAIFNGSSLTATLPNPPPANDWTVTILNINSSALTINPNGLSADGSTSTFTIGQYQNIKIWTDGSNYFYGSSNSGASSLFSSFQFGSQTPLTGSSLYLQTIYPNIFALSQTGSGTSGSPYIDTVALGTEAQNSVAAGPASGGPGAWSFRALVPADIPPLSSLTGFLDISQTPLNTSQDILFDNAGSLGRLPIVGPGNCLGNNAGAWASVACSAMGNSIFTSYQFGTQPAITGNSLYIQNTYPSSIFTAIQTGSGTSGSPYVDALGLANESPNTFAAGPGSGSAAPWSFRVLVGADLPVPSATTLGGIESITSTSHQWVSYIDTGGVPHQSQPNFSDLGGALALSQTPLTTTQDILYDNAGALGRLPIVTPGNCLGNSGGIWASLTCSGGSGGSTAFNLANAGTTGTTTSTLTKAPAGVALIAATSDTNGVLGVCTSGCGTTGSATITFAGSVGCSFDGSTTIGDYVQISSTTGGDCHDAGANPPLNVQVIGRVWSSNASAGTFIIDLFPPSTAPFVAGNGITCTNSAAGITCTYNTALIPTHDTIHAGEVSVSSINGTCAYTATMPDKALTAYSPLMVVDLLVDTTCSTPTLSLDGNAAIGIFQANGSTAGSVTAGQPQHLQLGPQGCVVGGSPACVWLQPPSASAASNYQTVQNAGSALTQRGTINFVNGGCVDNSGANRTDCTFSSTGGGGGLLGPALVAAPPGYTGVSQLYGGPLNEYLPAGAVAPVPYGPASSTLNGVTCWTSNSGSSLGSCGYFLTGTIYSAAGTPLPTCNSALTGARAVVADSTSPTYLGAYTSGGSVKAPVFCNGSGWVTD